MKEEKDHISYPTFDFIKKADDTSYWEKVGREMVDRESPIQLELELNTTCNLKCRKCIQNDPKRKPKPAYMDTGQILNILSPTIDLRSVKLQYRGEPLLSSIFLDAVRVCKIKGLYVHFNTNGQLLTRAIAKELVKLQVDKIIFSIDSSVAKDYDNNHQNGSFSKLFQNVIVLNALKNLYKSEKPIIRIQAVRQKFNEDELYYGDYEHFWEDYCNEMAFEDEFDFLDNSEDATPLPEWHCEQLWQRLVVLADLRVLPCCAGIDYNIGKVFDVGNLHQETVLEIWKGDKHRALQEIHKDGNSHLIEMCRKCRVRKNVVNKLKKLAEERIKI